MQPADPPTPSSRPPANQEPVINESPNFIAQSLQFSQYDPPPQTTLKKQRPLWHKWLWAPLTLLAAMIVFVLLMQPLKIVISPEDASANHQINFSTPLYLRWQERFLLLPGNHQVAVAAQGYYPLQKTFQISNEPLQQLELILEPLPGSLDIDLSDDSVPWHELQSQLSVTMDGQAIANNFNGQWSITELTAGDHQLTMVSPWHQHYEATIAIEGKGKHQQLSVELVPQWATVAIQSTPTAQIFINDISIGNTPKTIRSAIGQQQLRLQADGYKDHRQQLDLENLQQLQLPPIQLKPADVVISLSSEPSQATVLLSGEYRGLTPLQLSISPNQKSQLQLLKEGYQPYQQRLLVDGSNKALRRHINLKAIEVPVKFETQPKNALIRINGKAYGSANQTIELTAKAHQVEISLLGYQTKTFDLKLLAETQPTIKTRLLSNAEAQWQNTPSKITSAAGDTLLLFKPNHRLTIGSPTSEAGRRANEGQFDVVVKLPFYASIYEVTNNQFRQFMPAHSSGNFMQQSLNSNNSPVVNISWQQAALYCNWLSGRDNLKPFYKTIKGVVSGYHRDSPGYRLPTEAEWTWLSRYDAQVKNLTPYVIYPWNNSADKQSNSAKINRSKSAKVPENLADRSAQPILKFILDDYDDGSIVTKKPGAYTVHSSGLYDLGGNVSEWVHDWYQSDWFLERKHSPWGPEIGEFHVARGASWARGYLPQVRWSYRHYGAKGEKDVGFRVVRSVIIPATSD